VPAPQFRAKRSDPGGERVRSTQGRREGLAVYGRRHAAPGLSDSEQQPACALRSLSGLHSWVPTRAGALAALAPSARSAKRVPIPADQRSGRGHQRRLWGRAADGRLDLRVRGSQLHRAYAVSDGAMTPRTLTNGGPHHRRAPTWNMGEQRAEEPPQAHEYRIDRPVSLR